MPPANPAQSPVNFTGPYPSYPVQTLTQPPEGPRAVPINFFNNPSPTGWYKVEIPQWNSTNQTGLSQICALQFANSLSAGAESIIVWFPDTAQTYKLPADFTGVIPVYTSGLSFYINLSNANSPFYNLLVLNFFTPPISFPGAGSSSSVNVATINGVIPAVASGALEVDRPNFFPTSQSLNIPATGSLNTPLLSAGFRLRCFDIHVFDAQASSTASVGIQLTNNGVAFWGVSVTVPTGQIVDVHLPGQSFYRLDLTGTGLAILVNTFVGTISGGIIYANVAG